ncbi:hypothetical protein F4777DRAFT_584850 [Nemania sp. FL0916]|nr:hypothetical protein F4777DRAFT_584850 [Nemania sp. FL0916]
MSQPTPSTTPGPTKTVEPRDLTLTTGFGGPVTYTDICSICTPNSPYEVTNCVPLPGCSKPTGMVSVEAGTSHIHVGALTAGALYTGVSSALEKLCPTPTSSDLITCDENAKVGIPGVAWIDSESLRTDGELVVQVLGGSYNDSNIRSGLIMSTALAVNESAVGKNCYKASYNVLGFKRSESPWWVPQMFRRDAPHETPTQITLCNAIDFVSPRYWSPWWRDAAQAGDGVYDISTLFKFQEPPGGDFLCEVLEQAAAAFA